MSDVNSTALEGLKREIQEEDHKLEENRRDLGKKEVEVERKKKNIKTNKQKQIN